MACAASQQVTVWSQGLQGRGSFLCVCVGGHVCVVHSVESVSVGVVYGVCIHGVCVVYRVCVRCMVCGVCGCGGVCLISIPMRAFLCEGG